MNRDIKVFPDGKSLLASVQQQLQTVQWLGDTRGRPVMLLHFSQETGLQEFRAGSWWTSGFSTSHRTISDITYIADVSLIKSVYAIRYGFPRTHTVNSEAPEGTQIRGTQKATWELQLQYPIKRTHFIELPFP